MNETNINKEEEVIDRGEENLINSKNDFKNIDGSSDSYCLDQIDLNTMSISDVNLADILINKYDYLDSCISNENFDAALCSNLVLLLKFILENGPYLDNDLNHREQMDMFFTLFRNILRNHLKCLPESINLLILRLIEIRASKWKLECNIEEYYLNKVDQLSSSSSSNNNNNPIMIHGPIINNKNNRFSQRLSKCFGDYSNNNNNSNTNIAVDNNNFGNDDLLQQSSSTSSFRNSRLLKSNSKGVIKDEVLIKNSDSGKVMGIKGRRVHMIEEMSDTIISFQKVSPQAKERLVQITGYNRENIEKAKNLIDVTIRQNISPIPMSGFETNNYNNNNNFDGIDDDNIFFVQQQSSSNLKQQQPQPNESLDVHPQQYSFTLNISNNPNPVHIQISDDLIGQKLQQFLEKFNFLEFLKNNDKKIITYDRKFLLEIRDSIEDDAIINLIKLKHPNLLRK